MQSLMMAASSHVFLRENTWKKEDDARMMMRRPASPPFHSMHHLASHWSQFAIERNQSGCLLDVWWKKPTVICKRSFPEFTHQTTSKNVVLYEMKHQHWNWTFPETNVLTVPKYVTFNRPLKVFFFWLERWAARFRRQSSEWKCWP